MEFPIYDFDKMNETDVREEIVSPLLRHLGYRTGAENNIIREQFLSYPKSQLGHRKKNDPILRGKADYICEAKNKVRWTIEAKSPNEKLDQDAEEQAWSYANHPQIRAVYFCLTNGREFKIFQTNKGPGCEAIFECQYDQLQSTLTTLINVLSPDAILRDHPECEIDTGEPIGPGLRSIVQVASGSIIYQKTTPNIQQFIGLTMYITSGSVERNESGELEAYIETLIPFQSLQKLNEKLGLSDMLLFSKSSVVSVNPDNPTIFSSTTNHILPQGEQVLDIGTWQVVSLPMNIHVQTKTAASGYLEGNIFQGNFGASLAYLEFAMSVNLEGKFRVNIH